MRLGPGPVFAYEWLTTTRRWQLYGQRAAFVGIILIGMMFVWHNMALRGNPVQPVSIQALADYGESLYKTVVSIELTLVLLAAPAATAGAICLDKSRGTLDHMLATDLSNAEIVLGKIGVRLVPVLGLVACVLPITALTTLLGGIDPTAVLGSFLTAIACAFLGCSLALTLSVWGRKTHEVLMVTYLVLVLWLIAPLLLTIVLELSGTASAPKWQVLLGWVACSNPYYLAFAPYSVPGTVGPITYLAFLTVCLIVSALLLGLATSRIRGVALKQAGQPAARARRARLRRYFPTFSRWSVLPGPSLDGNPILWREWHRSEPSRLLRVVWLVYAALAILGVILTFNAALNSPANREIVALMSMFQVSLGLLLLSVSAATSLAEERVRGSLDILLCTPLSTCSILVGKWYGSFRQAKIVVIWQAILAGILVAESGRWIHYLLMLGLVTANAAVISSLGLLMATWISRLGRAVAVCVSAYVVFSIGWVVLAILFEFSGPLRDFTMAMVMGSPPYGAALATLAVAPGENRLPGGTNLVGVGAFIWIVIDSAVALLLFLAALATFDACLGRAPETTGQPIQRRPRKALAGADSDIDDWLIENSAELSGPIHP